MSVILNSLEFLESKISLIFYCLCSKYKIKSKLVSSGPAADKAKYLRVNEKYKHQKVCLFFKVTFDSLHQKLLIKGLFREAGYDSYHHECNDKQVNE